MSKFTPGPWYEQSKGIRAKSGFICFLSPKPTHYTGQDKRYSDELEERAANALLIAAAPDLYEALIYVLDAFDSSGECDCEGSELCVVCKAQKALAKADGK